MTLDAAAAAHVADQAARLNALGHMDEAAGLVNGVCLDDNDAALLAHAFAELLAGLDVPPVFVPSRIIGYERTLVAHGIVANMRQAIVYGNPDAARTLWARTPLDAKGDAISIAVAIAGAAKRRPEWN